MSLFLWRWVKLALMGRSKNVIIVYINCFYEKYMMWVLKHESRIQPIYALKDIYEKELWSNSTGLAMVVGLGIIILEYSVNWIINVRK